MNRTFWLNAGLGALHGFGGAFIVDLKEFRSYHSWAAWRNFDLSTASLRWFWGIVGGALTGAGLTGAAAMLGM